MTARPDQLPAKLADACAVFAAARRALGNAELELDRILASKDPKDEDITRAEDLLPGLRKTVVDAASALYDRVLASDPEENPWINSTQLMQRVADVDRKFKAMEQEKEREIAVLSRERVEANRRIDRLEGTAIDALMDLRDARADVQTLQMRVSG